MKTKMFCFPTFFEEWVENNKEIKIEIGAYRYEICRFAF